MFFGIVFSSKIGETKEIKKKIKREWFVHMRGLWSFPEYQQYDDDADYSYESE